MTIDFRSPVPGQEPALRALFTQAFGDEVFTELFFRLGYGPERCICAVSGEEVLAAAHWFDCTLEGKRPPMSMASPPFGTVGGGASARP